MQLVILGGYFALLFIGVMTWSKLRHRREKANKDAARPILRKIAEAEHAEEVHHATVGR